MKKQYIIILSLLVIGVLFLYGCNNNTEKNNAAEQLPKATETDKSELEEDYTAPEVESDDDSKAMGEEIKELPKTFKQDLPHWMNVELEDIKTGENYKISDFIGKPIIIESFAVWCPTCTKQQKETKKLHETVGDGVISIALDTDPNEDKSKVLNHINSNGFDWRYSIAPKELTKELIDEFGINIVSAPSVPMILIHEDGTYEKLRKSGVKDADLLIEAIGTK